jgi:hypothetical protein
MSCSAYSVPLPTPSRFRKTPRNSLSNRTLHVTSLTTRICGEIRVSLRKRGIYAWGEGVPDALLVQILDQQLAII